MVASPSRSARRSSQILAAETPSLRGLLTLAVGVVVVAGLYLGRDVLIPITLAVLLSFVLAPGADLLRRIHLGRIPSALLSVIIALGIILALGGLIGSQIADLAGNVPRYEATIQQKLNMLRALTVERILEVIQIGGPEARPNAPPAAKPAAAAAKDHGAPSVPVAVQQQPPAPLDLAERILSPVLSPLATLAIVFIVTIFVLLQRDDLRDRMIRLFGSSDLHRTTVAMDDAARRLSRYFLTQLGINGTFGLIIGSGLFLIGIPSPILWGVLAALLRFVPYVGSPLAAILPVTLGAAIDPGWAKMIWAGALFLVVEPIMGQAVEPILYGSSTGLSPVAVIVAAIFWAWLWGPIGLILSTPLSLCLVVLGRHVERLTFLDVILGDRPALTPVETFYQRALAGDADEAEDQAKQLLKEHALSSFYDEVALKSLQLAADDLHRGVLTPVQLDRIQEVIEELVEDLDEYDDVDPRPGSSDNDVIAPPEVERTLRKMPAPDAVAPDTTERAKEWQADKPVLCVAGRGPLDEAVSVMLAQLLEKHGLGAQVVPSDAVSRSAIGQLDMTGVAMTCVSYLDISGTMAPLRHLLRRLRHRMPNVRILVGLWSPGGSLSDIDRQRAAGTDYCVVSLRDAVIRCLESLQAASEQERPSVPSQEVVRTSPSPAPEDPARGT